MPGPTAPSGRRASPQIPPPEPVPATLDWDLWLGIAEKRPFTVGRPDYKSPLGGHFYQPFNWRGFYDFGCGALGDMACHILGAPNMALQLGAPTSVECIKKEGTSDFMFPPKSVIRYDFPARGNMPPVKLFWHDGLKETPKIPGVPEGELLGDLPRASIAARTTPPAPSLRRAPGSSAACSTMRSSRPSRTTTQRVSSAA